MKIDSNSSAVADSLGMPVFPAAAAARPDGAFQKECEAGMLRFGGAPAGAPPDAAKQGSAAELASSLIGKAGLLAAAKAAPQAKMPAPQATTPASQATIPAPQAKMPAPKGNLPAADITVEGYPVALAGDLMPAVPAAAAAEPLRALLAGPAAGAPQGSPKAADTNGLAAKQPTGEAQPASLKGKPGLPAVTMPAQQETQPAPAAEAAVPSDARLVAQFPGASFNPSGSPISAQACGQPAKGHAKASTADRPDIKGRAKASRTATKEEDKSPGATTGTEVSLTLSAQPAAVRAPGGENSLIARGQAGEISLAGAPTTPGTGLPAAPVSGAPNARPECPPASAVPITGQAATLPAPAAPDIPAAPVETSTRATAQAAAETPATIRATPAQEGSRDQGSIAFVMNLAEKQAPAPAQAAAGATVTPEQQARSTADAPAKPAAQGAGKASPEVQASRVGLFQTETSAAPADARPGAPAPARPAAAVALPPEAAQPEAVNQISLTIEGRNSEAAQVRLSRRGADVVVSVRGSDQTVVESLRGNLPDLVTKVESHGVKAEVWQPAGSSSQAKEHGSNREPDSGRNPEGDFSQQQQGAGARHGRHARPQWLDDIDEPAAQTPRRHSS